MDTQQATAQLAKCQCGHPRIDHRHGGSRSDHCLHRSVCWGHEDCFPCHCDSFEPRGMSHSALVALLLATAEPCTHPDTEPVLREDRVVDVECLLCGTTASEGFEA